MNGGGPIGGAKLARDARTPSAPAPTLDSGTRAAEVFARARDVADDAALDALLARECADDAPLRAEVLALLGRDGAPGSTPSDVVAARGELPAGTMLGDKYRVASHLGTGGVGIVYRADQLHPVARQVAIKVLSGGIAGAALARFEAERDALSRLGHPHIAAIYDAGQTQADKLYVVMELVDGLPIDEYCDRHALGLEARINLFLRVCRGVHHAHQRGIIHRDLKPTNILVAEVEGEAIPKIIDFGIAVVSGDTPTRGASPATATQFVGTPDYASPEQAGAGDVTTTSDVYSLGIVLFQLLTGDVPHRLQGSLLAWKDAMATRAVPRPSAFLADAPPEPGPTTPPIPARALKGDLDAIIQKATARERERRYAAVSELAADLERWLQHRPVLARPNTLPYVTARFIARNRGPSIAAIAALIGLLASIVAFGQMAAQSEREHRRAEDAAREAQAERALATERQAQADLMAARSHLASAAAALAARDADGVQKHLDAIPERFRGWEWQWLGAETDRSQASFRAHAHGITALVPSADGTRLASGASDGELALWDVRAAPRLVARVQAHARAIRGLALSPDGTLVFTSDAATRLVAWDAATLREVWHLDGAYGLHPAGTRLDGDELVVAGRDDSTLVFLAPETGKPTRVERLGQGTLEHAAFAHDGRVVYSTSSRVVVLDAAGGHPRSFAGRLTAVDAERRRVVVWAWSEWDRRRVVDLDSGQEVGHIDRAGGINDVALGGDLSLALSDFEHAIGFAPDLAHAATWFPGHHGPVDALALAPDGRSVWAGDATGVVKRWPRGLAPAPFAVGQTNDAALGSALAPDGKTFATVGWGTVKLWDALRGTERWTRWLSRKYLTAVGFSPDGRELAAADWRGHLWHLAPADGAPSEPLELGPGAPVTRLAYVGPGAAVAVTRSGELMAFATADGHIAWRRVAHHDTPIAQLALSPDRRLVATAGASANALPTFGEGVPDAASPDPTVKLWRSDSGAPAVDLEPALATWTALAFSADGSVLAAGADDGTLAQWRVADGRLLAPPTRLGDRITGLTFSRDARRLLVGRFGSVVIVDAARLTPLLTLDGPPANYQTMALDDAGRLTILGSVYPLVVFDPRPDDVALHGRTTELRALVDARFERAAGVDAVVSDLAADASLDPALRADAIALARARGDNPNGLNSWAWAAVRYPGEAKATVALARQRAELCADRWPRWEFENTRALARYRDGDAAGALSAAEKSLALAHQNGIAASPSDWAIQALAHAALGARDAAQADLDRASRDAETDAWRDDAEVRAMVEEVRGVLEPAY